MIFPIDIMDYTCYLDDIIMKSEGEKRLGLSAVDRSGVMQDYSTMIFKTEEQKLQPRRPLTFEATKLTVVLHYMMRKDDIPSLPFYDFICKSQQKPSFKITFHLHVFTPFSCCLH